MRWNINNYVKSNPTAVRIPSGSREKLARFIDKVSSLVTGLNVVDADVPLDILLKNNKKLEEIALGREFHISLGRTVPIRVHQIESVLSMLRQKPQLRRRSACISCLICHTLVLVQKFYIASLRLIFKPTWLTSDFFFRSVL